ncbi:hypothetical protein LWI29_005980 [Acer saccharum]|uniref:NB-ARC domain-containing protein n=1 Tax=Acer saccharum TaxID=4024 RepID=A0AA39W2D4_ACESA|nr:hypothetical protein LWI29_005980 [Acer saccharum]
MDSRNNFPVNTLEKAEAWSLFKKTAGTCVDHPDLKSIAPKVAKECGNMPLAIVTIANALKNKGESTWSNALDELKNPSSESIEGITKEVYTSIKLSYDYLDSEELRKIFLLCSHMGCHYDASIRDLFRYGLGLGFFKRSNTLEKAQCRVEDLVKKLKDNSLLLDAPNETSESHSYSISDSERFAMHDVICDVARSIACEKGNVCIVIDDVISCRWAKTNILKNCNSITLHDIGELPKDLKIPQKTMVLLLVTISKLTRNRLNYLQTLTLTRSYNSPTKKPYNKPMKKRMKKAALLLVIIQSEDPFV